MSLSWFYIVELLICYIFSNKGRIFNTIENDFSFIDLLYPLVSSQGTRAEKFQQQVQLQISCFLIFLSISEQLSLSNVDGITAINIIELWLRYIILSYPDLVLYLDLIFQDCTHKLCIWILLSYCILLLKEVMIYVDVHEAI